MFINKNHALEKSNKCHLKRTDSDINGKNSNILLCDYHSDVYGWQVKNKRIMPHYMRRKVYDKTVFKKTAVK